MRPRRRLNGRIPFSDDAITFENIQDTIISSVMSIKLLRFGVRCVIVEMLRSMTSKKLGTKNDVEFYVES